MFSRLISFILVVAFVSIAVKATDEVNLIDVIESLSTRKLIQGLANDDTLNSTCKDHIEEYFKSLLKQEWALKMFDSSANIPDGIFTGNTIFLGHFDECIKTEHPNHTFTGKHCMLHIDINLGNLHIANYKSTNLFEVRDTGTSILSLFYALCLPSTCSAIEIETALNGLTNNTMLEGVFTFVLEERNTWTTENRKLSDGDWVVVGFFVVICVIALASTIYDLIQRFAYKKDKPHPLLISFSIYSNGSYLFHISESSSQMKALHGLRTLSMCWVVLCHAYFMLIYAPVVNLSDVATMVMDTDHIPISNGFVSVDSFFFLSGLLVCFVFFRDIGTKKYYDVPVGYIHRYLRLTPPFAVMMLFVSTLYKYLNKGPLWRKMIDSAAETCQQNWWAGILYVQNYIASDSSCLGQSWYLSADMQMYWIAPFILYPILIWPIYAPAFLGLLIIASGFTTFAVGYVNGLGPTALLPAPGVDQMALDYAPFHTRLAPWLIGLTTGYILCGIQAKKIKINLTKFWVIVGWLIATGLCLGSLYGVKAFLNNDHYTTLQAAFYLSFHRLGWGFGLAWITFACVQGYGGSINKFLSWNIFQPLGKLSYCTFLIHLSLQSYRLATMQTSIYGGDFEIVYYFLGDLVLANLLSIPFTLLFEIPFGVIDKYLFKNVKILPLPWPKKTSKKKDSNNNGKNDSNKNDLNDVKNDVEAGNANEAFEKGEEN